MITDLGMVEPGRTIRIPIHTFDSNDPSASVTTTGFAATDIEIFKDGSTTQRASDSGYTATTDFDGITGTHLLIIDLADNTTAGFWAAGSEYLVQVSSITVDGATINFWAARFRIGYPSAILNTTIASLSSQTSFTLTDGPAEADALNGMWCVIHDVASAVQKGYAVILDYAATTKTVTLVAGTTFTAAATDNISIMGPSPLQPTVTGRTLDVSAGGEAGIDWANVGTPGSTVSLSATTVATVTTTTTATTATNLTNLPAITSNWLTAAGLATDAVNEIADGILGRDASTSTTNSTLGAIINDWENGGRLDLIVDDILVDTGTTLDGRIPAALVGGRIDATVDGTGMEAGAVTAIQSGLATSAALATVDTAVAAIQAGLIMATTTIGSTGNDTTHVHLSTLTYGDDEINDHLLVIYDNSTGETHARWVSDWVNATKLATVATLPFTPENAVDTYYLICVRQDVTGGSGPSAATIADAVWDELQADHVSAGSFGEIVMEIAEILTDIGTTLQGELDGIQADTEDIQSRLPAALVNSRMDCTIDGTGMETGAVDAILNRDASASTTNSTLGAIINDLEDGGRTDLIVDAILLDTAEIGAAGAGLTEAGGTGDQLTAIPWNASWDTEVQSECTDALNAYDPPTKAETDALLTTAMTESYATDGSTMTVAQALYLILANVSEFAISGTTLTAKKLDGSTTAATYTLDDATNPTSRTRAS